jgi:1,2-dihydroxy-3-keto-5-methylthiopentene dioxygenase
MGALVRFDADGHWLDTWVCDGLIGDELARAGLAWGRWPVRHFEGSDAEAVRTAYGEEIAALRERFEVRSADRVRLAPGHAGWPALRAQFLAEHTHSDAEIRFFLEGAGLFYLRSGEGYLGLLCEAGEWVALPAGTRHFFDAGAEPDFDALRLFADPQGWIAQPADDSSLPALPLFDDFVEHLLALTGHEAD